MFGICRVTGPLFDPRVKLHDTHYIDTAGKLLNSGSVRVDDTVKYNVLSSD